MSKSRIHLLDELRGFCLVLMIAFHAFYTVGAIFNLQIGRDLFNFFRPVEPFFAGIFIMLCGFSCRLSHNNLKRGVLLLLVAAAMSLVLLAVMPDQMIYFGVLHCLAVCILLFVAFRKALNRVPAWLGVIVSVLLIVLTWHFPFYDGGYIGFSDTAWWSWPTAWGDNTWLLSLGIGTYEWYGSDYFPLIPWVFVFLTGTFLGTYHRKLPAFTRKKHIPALAFLGRNTLIIYIVHQPIIYGICYAVSWLFK